MEGQKEQDTKKPRLKLPVWILIAAAVMVVAFGIGLPAAQRANQQAEIVTVSTLQKIVNVSELSTYTAVYNGIATVCDEEKTGEVEYYVSYEAKVYAGIDFEALDIEMDEAEKIIHITLPEARISSVDVDISSMDFLFYDDKANESTVSEEAYKACEKDAWQESEKQAAICDLAKDNACNVLKALVTPLVEQADTGYTLTIS